MLDHPSGSFQATQAPLSSEVQKLSTEATLPTVTRSCPGQATNGRHQETQAPTLSYVPNPKSSQRLLTGSNATQLPQRHTEAGPKASQTTMHCAACTLQQTGNTLADPSETKFPQADGSTITMSDYLFFQGKWELSNDGTPRTCTHLHHHSRYNLASDHHLGRNATFAAALKPLTLSCRASV